MPKRRFANNNFEHSSEHFGPQINYGFIMLDYIQNARAHSAWPYGSSTEGQSRFVVSSFVVRPRIDQQWHQSRPNMVPTIIKDGIKIDKNCVWTIFSAMSRPRGRDMALTGLQPCSNRAPIGLQPRASPLVFWSPFYQKSKKHIPPKTSQKRSPKIQNNYAKRDPT